MQAKTQMPLNPNEFDLFKKFDLTVDTSKFLLSPDAERTIRALRVELLADKANINGLDYLGREKELAAAYIRQDIALSLYQYLLELNDANRQKDTTNE